MELYGYYPDVLSYHRYLNQLHSKRRNSSTYSNSPIDCDTSQKSPLVAFEANQHRRHHQDTTAGWQPHRWISDKLDLVVNNLAGNGADCCLPELDEQSAIFIQLGIGDGLRHDDLAPLPEDLADLKIEGNLTCDVELVCLFELFISGDTNFDQLFLDRICP